MCCENNSRKTVISRVSGTVAFWGPVAVDSQWLSSLLFSIMDWTDESLKMWSGVASKFVETWCSTPVASAMCVHNHEASLSTMITLCQPSLLLAGPLCCKGPWMLVIRATGAMECVHICQEVAPPWVFRSLVELATFKMAWHLSSYYLIGRREEAKE